MSRLGGINLFGSLYDPEKNRRVTQVFNQNPTGRAGQAASFAAAQEAERQRQQQQAAAAQAAAQQQQQQVQQEAQAAQQRQEAARQQALQEQEFKLREAQFNNDRAVQAQQLEEQKRAARATEAAQQNQQRAARGTSAQQQMQRALGGSNMAQSMQNHNARLKGQLSPFPNQLTPGAYSREITGAAKRGTSGALQALNQNRTGLGYRPISQQHLNQWGNGASYNLSASRSTGGGNRLGGGHSQYFSQ